MKNRCCCFILLALCALPVSANSLRIFNLSAEDWARPRAGAMMPEFAALRAALEYWESTVDARIVIRYPGEDSGEIWASELRDWLISLAVPSDYIQLASGAQSADEIRILVGTATDLQQ